MSKPNGQKPVQTLLAPRHDLNKKDKDKQKSSEKNPKLPKRTLSDVEKSDHSMDLSLDLTEITKELQEIKGALKQNITKKDLDIALQAVVKQSDIETMVTNIVNNLLTNFKKEIKKEIDEQISKILDSQNKEIEKLKQDLNENIIRLNKKCIDQYLETNKLTRILDDVYSKAEEALSMANYNEQYSRKFNIKMTNFPEDNDNNIKDNFVKMLKDDLKVEINNNDIIAIHR